MKPNTPEFLCVPCDHLGRLILVGTAGQTATFMATGIIILGDVDDAKKCIEASPKIKGNYIVAKPVQVAKRAHGTEVVIIFQSDFDGTLRNPKGFLKSIRHLLNGILYCVNTTPHKKPSGVEVSDTDHDEQKDDDYGYEDDQAYDEHCKEKSICPRCGSLFGECFCGYAEETLHDAEERSRRPC